MPIVNRHEKGKPMKKPRMPLLSVRISQDVWDDLRNLLPKVQQHPNFRGGLINLQDVYRLALSRGVDILKKEMEKELGNAKETIVVEHS